MKGWCMGELEAALNWFDLCGEKHLQGPLS